MKAFSSIVLLSAVLAYAWAAATSETSGVISKIKSKSLRTYLEKNSTYVDQLDEHVDAFCEGSGDKIWEALEQFLECTEKADDSLTMCEQIQKYSLNCTKPIIEVLQECLPPKAKPLPNLGMKSLISLTDYLCKQPGEAIFEIANPCLWEDDDEEENECEEKVNSDLKDLKDDIPDVGQICSLTGGWRSCFQTRINKSCKNQKTRNVGLGVYDAIVAPCKTISSNEIKKN